MTAPTTMIDRGDAARAEPGPRAAATHDLVVVANRLPVVAVPAEGDDAPTWERAPGGLVSALEPVLREVDAVWVGWSGVASDAEQEAPSAASMPGPVPLVDVPLTSDLVQRYYEGCCNATLWPLYHDAIATPVYHRETWDAYVEVNRIFADAVAAAASYGARVWVHDLQLQLVPAMLRSLRPDLRIGFFLHTPFPPLELFAQLPWRREVVAGLLGSDLVGLHTPHDAARFLAAVERFSDAAVVDGEVLVPGTDGVRRVRAGAFPISVDAREYDAIARTPQAMDKAAEIRSRLGDPTHVVLGVDRLDYTKGIDVRLKAFTELLESGDVDARDTVFVQIATPTRENVEEYQRLRDDIATMVGQVIGDHTEIGVAPVQYLHQPIEREELVGFYLAADVMLVTPYRDGMNLVCKEFVASRHDGDGALVLSEFAGAAVELQDAYQVNPHDAEAMKRTLLEAMHATSSDRRARMAAMREIVFAHDSHAWAAGFLGALDEVAATAETGR